MSALVPINTLTINALVFTLDCFVGVVEDEDEGLLMVTILFEALLLTPLLLADDLLA